jgi:hypothetical protein
MESVACSLPKSTLYKSFCFHSKITRAASRRSWSEVCIDWNLMLRSKYGGTFCHIGKRECESRNVSHGHEHLKRREHYVWIHDSIQQAVYNTLSPKGKKALYSRIGKAFLQAIKPEHLKDLLYEVLAFLNKGVDIEDLVQCQTVGNLNLFCFLQRF